MENEFLNRNFYLSFSIISIEVDDEPPTLSIWVSSFDDVFDRFGLKKCFWLTKTEWIQTYLDGWSMSIGSSHLVRFNSSLLSDLSSLLSDLSLSSDDVFSWNDGKRCVMCLGYVRGDIGTLNPSAPVTQFNESELLERSEVERSEVWQSEVDLRLADSVEWSLESDECTLDWDETISESFELELNVSSNISYSP